MSDDDDYHARFSGFIDVLAHAIDLPVVPPRAIWSVQMKHWDGIGFGEGTHSVSEPIANLPEQDRRRDRVAKVFGKKGDHLAANL